MSPYSAWLRLNALYVLACLLACLLDFLPTYLLSLEPFYSHSEHNITLRLLGLLSEPKRQKYQPLYLHYSDEKCTRRCFFV